MLNKGIVTITENLLNLTKELRKFIGYIFEPLRITPVAYVAGISVPSEGWSAVTMLKVDDLSVLDYQEFEPGNVVRLALSPARPSLWVSDERGHKIYVLDTNTLDILGDPIDLNLVNPNCRPCDIVARQNDEPEAWIVYRNEESSMSGHEILVYNMNDRRLLRRIPIDIQQPNAIVLTPDNRTAYVLGMTPPQVAVIDCALGRPIDSPIDIDPPGQLQEAVVHPNSRDVYITNRGAGRIEHIVGNTAESPISTDPFPRGIGISPDGNYLFVGHGSEEGGVGRVNMLRLSDNVVVSTVTTGPGSNPRTIAVSSTSDRIVVTDHINSGGVYVFEVDYARESLREVASVLLSEELGYDYILPVEVVLGSVITGGILRRLFRL
jgi:DNA-binding beta-propeller fold protein YncE